MPSNRLLLEVDASSIDVRQLLQKDFLELSMRAISSANPNRNNSWFTPESMAAALPSFINKPILGYFENGDFVSHNGEWGYDSETELDYWDTLGTKGERVLGLIRESDAVRVVQDPKDGLSWITFTCALWTQYSFRQVKRLIKDAKRAQKRGGAAKNISVEVDITDYEMLPNGVMKINAFNLVGVTILGSRNGQPVEPGIENAELSVVDIMGRDLYERQAQSVRLAYEKLDGPKENKEVKQMPEEEKVVFEETSAQPEEECRSSNEAEPEVCPDCGKNPCECEAKPEQEQGQMEEEPTQCEEQESCPECEEKADECGGKCEAEAAEEEPADECKNCKNEADPEEKSEEECKMEEDPSVECKNEAKPEEEPKEECENCKNSVYDSEEYKALEASYAELQGKFEALTAERDAFEAAKMAAETELEAVKSELTMYRAEHPEVKPEPATFSAPVSAPAVARPAVIKPQSKADAWSALREYVGK